MRNREMLRTSPDWATLDFASHPARCNSPTMRRKSRSRMLFPPAAMAGGRPRKHPARSNQRSHGANVLCSHADPARSGHQPSSTHSRAPVALDRSAVAAPIGLLLDLVRIDLDLDDVAVFVLLQHDAPRGAVRRHVAVRATDHHVVRPGLVAVADEPQHPALVDFV